MTAAIGLDGAFDRLYGFEDAGYVPKPEAAAFAPSSAATGSTRGAAAMFEDDQRNLAVPHALGMRTVLVGPLARRRDAHPHVHHATDDLVAFLALVAP